MMDLRILKEKLIIYFGEGIFNFDARRRFNKFIHFTDNILDIGALDSPLTKGLNNKVTAIDILPEDNQFGFSEKTIKKLERRPNIEFIVMDAQYLKFKENQFDIVILTEVLEHIQNDRRAASEIIRVLKPNGYLLLTVPHLERVPLEHGIKEHYRHYQKKDLLDLFGKEKIILLKDRFKFNEFNCGKYFISKFNKSKKRIYLLCLPIEAEI